ncbi:MAG: hypothetical protein JST54_24460 [Deltaproteobacteria bacterium]|nr:hypothetical protein [Deltaproteobacteria bacterium]
MLRSLCAAAVLFASTSAFAAATKTYQVTGPVLDVTDDAITVQKGTEKWEIARDPSTKGDAPKKGDKVTIEYRMTATTITVKPAKGGKAAPKADAK